MYKLYMIVSRGIQPLLSLFSSSAVVVKSNDIWQQRRRRRPHLIHTFYKTLSALICNSKSPWGTLAKPEKGRMNNFSLPEVVFLLCLSFRHFTSLTLTSIAHITFSSFRPSPSIISCRHHFSLLSLRSTAYFPLFCSSQVDRKESGNCYYALLFGVLIWLLLRSTFTLRVRNKRS